LCHKPSEDEVPRDRGVGGHGRGERRVPVSVMCVGRGGTPAGARRRGSESAVPVALMRPGVAGADSEGLHPSQALMMLCRALALDLRHLQGVTRLRFPKGPAGCRSGKLLSERRVGSA